MAKRRKRWLIGLSALALATALATPAVHWRLIGWARGEAFCQGWPTSYWRHVVANCKTGYVLGDFVDPYESGVSFSRPPTALDIANHWVADTVGWYLLSDSDRSIGLRCQPDAVPMLTAFLGDEDTKVRRFAADNLGRIGAPAVPALPALRRSLPGAPGADFAIKRILRDANIEDPTGKGQ